MTGTERNGTTASPLPKNTGPAIAAALLTAALLSIVKLVVRSPVMLIADRFMPGLGWVEVVLLSAYAAWLARTLGEERKVRTIRPIVWRLFSTVFFTQLLLGLFVSGTFLMTGKLHLPVPAMIVGGPLYRGSGFFMPVLFASTLLLVGPAWCSWLCYVGSWDDFAARKKKWPQTLPTRREAFRVSILLGIVGTALALRFSGATGTTAAWLGGAFGIAGVGVMLLASRRRGVMVHCTTWCPIGLFADLLGKLSPFRLRIGAGCDRCMACQKLCRYGALERRNLERGKPAITCTLCGDCLAACKTRQIGYRFFGLSAGTSRRLFFVLVVSLHAVFLGVARI